MPHLADIIIILILAVIVFCIVRGQIRNRCSGRRSCGCGGCTGCTGNCDGCRSMPTERTGK